MEFKLHSPYKPTGDQPQAIEKLVKGIKTGDPHQVLLGVTGSGKTFAIANVIQQVQKPTLVISHNKTLAAQLYQEFRDFFPENAVSYFVSYYDYYQPEAYLPATDTYIEKETDINQDIDKLRLQATTALSTRKDVIVVASVSCIYNIGSPEEYITFTLPIQRGQIIERQKLFSEFIRLGYIRGDYDFRRGTFRVRGETIDIHPSYQDEGFRIIFENDIVKDWYLIDPLVGKRLEHITNLEDQFVLYPTKHYMTDPKKTQAAFGQIRRDLKEQVDKFKKENKLIEAYRLNQRVNYDLEMINEIGYVNGIENYSRYFDGRKPGDPPYCLMNYFPKDYLLVIDESHMTIPQIRGMYNGDRARKEVLISYGFRLPAAFDNRPLKFDEFIRRMGRTIYTSATPADWEISMARQQGEKGIVEQLIRPTGLIDPEISVRPTENQIADLIEEIKKRVREKERVLVTTLTKRMAEDLSTYLEEQKIKVHYLHSEIETLERSDILDDLRVGKYDVVVGINLLREGLDLPEVSLVAILDADKEGFLRSETSLVQTMGRAARHVNGYVIMYADIMTGSMKRAMSEVKRRRKIQIAYNKKHHLSPKTIKKPIRESLIRAEERTQKEIHHKQIVEKELETIKPENLVPEERKIMAKKLRHEMNLAARDLNFELAAQIRDKIREIEGSS